MTSKPSSLALMISLVAICATSLAMQDSTLPEAVKQLASSLKGKGPAEAGKVIHKALGEPARMVGSGVRIEQWDVAGGSVTYNPIAGVSFVAGGKSVSLIETHNRIDQNVIDSYEMTTPPTRGTRYWMGNLELRKDGSYQFTDSHQNLDERKSSGPCFFVTHPTGRYELRISQNLEGSPLLENVPAGSEVCKLKFTPSDGGKSMTYTVTSDPVTRRLAFGGPNAVAFRMDRGWSNVWK